MNSRGQMRCVHYHVHMGRKITICKDSIPPNPLFQPASCQQPWFNSGLESWEGISFQLASHPEVDEWARLLGGRVLLLGGVVYSVEEILHEWSHPLTLSGTQFSLLQDRSGWTRPYLGVLSPLACLCTNQVHHVYWWRSHWAQKLPNWGSRSLLEISLHSISFLGRSVVKNTPANVGDMGSIRGSGRSHGAAKPSYHNYWAQVPPVLKPVHPRACALQQEEPPQWEAQAPQWRAALTTTRENPSAATKTQHSLQ